MDSCKEVAELVRKGAYEFKDPAFTSRIIGESALIYLLKDLAKRYSVFIKAGKDELHLFAVDKLSIEAIEDLPYNEKLDACEVNAFLYTTDCQNPWASRKIYQVNFNDSYADTKGIIAYKYDLATTVDVTSYLRKM